MKLRYSPTSPYVRKVVATAIETGLESKIERIPTDVWDAGTDIAEDNPLGKIPALITDSGQILYDSPVICEYLDSLHDGANLFPSAGGARWTALRRQALADGMVENIVHCFIESMRKPERQSQGWIAHNRAAVERTLAALEGEADALGEAVTVGHLAIAVALEMVDMHFGDMDWRGGHPGLAAWFAGFARRPSIQAAPLKDPREAAS